MNQLPLDLEGLNLMEDSDSNSSSSSQVGELRVLRKRPVDSLKPEASGQKRRCLQLPQKKETLAQIKKLYLNLTFKAPNPKNLETIYEECDEKAENVRIGKQKIRRSILFRDGAINKCKARHRKKMVKRLDSGPGPSSRTKKKVRLSLDAVLGRLAEELENTDVNQQPSAETEMK